MVGGKPLKKGQELGFGDKDHLAILGGGAGAAKRGLLKKMMESDDLSVGRLPDMFNHTGGIPFAKFDLARMNHKDAVGRMPFVDQDLPLAEGQWLPFLDQLFPTPANGLNNRRLHILF